MGKTSQKLQTMKDQMTVLVRYQIFQMRYRQSLRLQTRTRFLMAVIQDSTWLSSQKLSQRDCSSKGMITSSQSLDLENQMLKLLMKSMSERW